MVLAILAGRRRISYIFPTKICRFRRFPVVLARPAPTRWPEGSPRRRAAGAVRLLRACFDLGAGSLSDLYAKIAHCNRPLLGQSTFFRKLKNACRWPWPRCARWCLWLCQSKNGKPFSCLSKAILPSTPPAPENPPIPFLDSTRWHGIMTGMGFAPHACPTGCAGTPSALAISP